MNEGYFRKCRLGHIGHLTLQQIHKDAYLLAFAFKSFMTCESFSMGKLPESPFLRSGEGTKASWS